MERRKIAAVGLAAVVLLGIGFLALNGSPVNCDRKYDQAVNGDIAPEEIPEQCKPIPQDVEKQLLRQALTG